MIEEAAYYRAERRSFSAGDPVADWLEAEAEIDRMLQKEPPAGEKPGPIEQFEAQLKALDEEIRRLMGKARGVQAQVRTDLEQELERLRPLRQVAEERLTELRGRSGEAWEEVRKGVDRAREDLNSALSAITRRWR
jgi:DNA repair exonuclease SbcCD ATPase subunit